MEISKYITLDYAKIELLNDHIVRVYIFDKHSIGENESRKINDAIGVLTQGKPARIMMVPSTTTVFETGAREFSASDEGLQFTIADAMVVTNLAHRILVSFYLKLNKPKKPSKAFDNEEEAIQWLLTQS